MGSRPDLYSLSRRDELEGKKAGWEERKKDSVQSAALVLVLRTIEAQLCRWMRPGAVPELLKAAARPSLFGLPITGK